MGLMGEVGRTVLAGLGKDAVMGVIPAALQPREVRTVLAVCKSTCDIEIAYYIKLAGHSTVKALG